MLKQNETDIQRENINKNTKNLIEEINDLDEDIMTLQGTLLNAFFEKEKQTPKILPTEKIYGSKNT